MVQTNLKILVACNFPYYPMVVCKGLIDRGHLVSFVHELCFPHRTTQDHEAFINHLIALRPHFFMSFNNDMIDGSTPVTLRVLQVCKELSIPFVTFVADHPGLGNWNHTYKIIDELGLKDSMHFLCVAQGWVDFLRTKGFKAEKVFMPIEDGFAGFSLAGNDFRQVDLSFSGGCFPVAHLQNPPPVLQEALSDEELRLMHIDFVLDRWAQEFSKIAESKSEFNEQLELCKRVITRYMNYAISSPAEFEKTRAQCLHELRILKPGYFEVADDHWGTLTYSYSYLKHCVSLQRLQKKNIRIFGADWNRFLKMPKDYVSEWGTRDKFYDLCLRTRVYFCQHKEQMMDGINERILVASALGGFPLSDYQDDFDHLFEKDEIATYRSLDEAENKIDYYLKNESERLAIAKRGREKVLKTSTSGAFANRFYDILLQKWKLA